MGRLWAFAKEGTSDFEHYWKDKEQWREALRKAFGERIPSEIEANEFVSRLVSRTVGKPKNASVVPTATKLLLKHFSPTDALMAKESVDFGAGAAKYLGISPSERPAAALFIARTREALEKVHRDFPAVGKFEEALGKIEGKKIPLKDVYELTIGHRLKPAARAIGKNAFADRGAMGVRHLVFGLCDVPEALWLGERRLAKR